MNTTITKNACACVWAPNVQIQKWVLHDVFLVWASKVQYWNSKSSLCSSSNPGVENPKIDHPSALELHADFHDNRGKLVPGGGKFAGHAAGVGSE